jgi:hypothetical protein
MKYWKYYLIQSVSENGEPVLAEHLIEQNEVNEEIAKREAYNGEYEPFDDGQPELEEQPTQLDIIEAQITYTAMMTDTLLTEV